MGIHLAILIRVDVHCYDLNWLAQHALTILSSCLYIQVLKTEVKDGTQEVLVQCIEKSER